MFSSLGSIVSEYASAERIIGSIVSEYASAETLGTLLYLFDVKASFAIRPVFRLIKPGYIVK